MKKCLISLLCFLPIVSLAQNVVSYTATSKVSQKDADKKAMEGVALQIGAQVKYTFETQTIEKSDGSIERTADSKKTVSTNILLKGAKISVGERQGGLYKSTVSVDLDQLSSKILLDLETRIRKQVKSKDSLVRLDMLDRDYRKMETDMIALEKLVVSYDEQIENLSFLKKVPKELLLESTLGELTEFLISSMSSLKFETKLERDTLFVVVQDFAGAIANFPIVLTQDKKNLLTGKTDAKGVVAFPLSQIKKNKPSGEVNVHADMNFRFVRQSALHSTTVSYASEMKGSKYSLVCNATPGECFAVQKILNEAGYNVVQEKGENELSVHLLFSDKPNSQKTLYNTRATVSFKVGDKELVEQVQGVGRDAESAHLKAISKVRASTLEKIFGN